MIIIGYQGIGKSSLSGRYNCIDLESGNFWKDGSRIEDWYYYYCNIAIHLSQQGYTVFTSSHKEVREELKRRILNNEMNEEVINIVPHTSLKEEWIRKLKVRYELSGLEKDYKAWKNAEDRYEENINEIGNSFNTYYIMSMDYSLIGIIDRIKREVH